MDLQKINEINIITDEKDKNIFEWIIDEEEAPTKTYKKKRSKKGWYDSKEPRYLDPIRLFRNLETIFKSLRKEDIKKWDLPINENNLLQSEKIDLKKKIISFLKYSLLTNENSEKYPIVFSNRRFQTFKAGIFKGGFRFFKTITISPLNKKIIIYILWGYIYFLYVIFFKYLRSQRLRIGRSRRRIDKYIEFFNIEDFYFFFNKSFKDYFFTNEIFNSVQLGYTMDIYQEFYLLDLYNIQCLFEWEPFYIQFNFNDILTKEGDAIRPKVKVLGDKSPFKKKLILYWVTNPDFRPRWTLDHYDLDFSNYTGSFFDIYCIFEYLYEEYMYNFMIGQINSCHNYLFNTFKANFFDTYRHYNFNLYNYKKKIFELRLYKTLLLKNFYFKQVSFNLILKKIKKIIRVQKKILLEKSIDKQINYFGSFFCIKPLTILNVKKYIYILKKFAKLYLSKIQLKITNLIKCITPYRYNDLLRLFHHYIPLRKFIIFLPYTFFILYPFYCLYYRRMRYTYYIRNQIWLNEYTSLKQYYTLGNHSSGNNINKIYYWKFWKIWILQNFNLSKKIFTNLFGLYTLTYMKRDFYINNNNIISDFNFYSLDQTTIFDFYKNVIDKKFFHLICHFVKDQQRLIHYKVISSKWKFFIRFKSVYQFYFANLDYELNINHFLYIMYQCFDDRLWYWNNYNFKVLSDNFLKWYLEDISPSYFLNDLFTYDNINLFNQGYKINMFYLNIITSILYATNPQYFWKFYFTYWPQNKNFYVDFMFKFSFYLFFLAIENIKLVGNTLHYLVIKLRWHWNISYYFMYYNYEYFLVNNITEIIKKSRLKILWHQMCFYFQEKQLEAANLSIYSKYYEILTDIYYQLIIDNIEYLLLLFFLDIETSYLFYYEFNNFFFKNFQVYWNTILSYRYTSYNNICTFEYFHYWFMKRNLFDLWIYANYDIHEGQYFYRKSIDVLF